jgi:ribonuclease D
MTDDTTMIDTPAALEGMARDLAGAPCLAVDTEFVWERTFYAQLGLIQLGTQDGTCFLIDPVALTDLSPLGELLANPAIVKILHDAPQDLMILRRATGAVPQTIFDTRLAAGFAGLSSETSLQNLLINLLGIELPKGHTRANWIARPLSGEQLEYAADDVRHLPRAAALLREKARESGVEAWLDEELQLLNAPSLTEESSARDAYRRIRGSGRLSPRSLSVLRELAAWREEEAKNVDLPRQHVVEDSELLSIAFNLPTRSPDFEKCRDLRRRTEQRYSESLLAAVLRGIALSETDAPVIPESPDERKIGKERITATTELIRTAAAARQIDARLVGTKNDIMMLLHEGKNARPENHRLLRGWRAELLKDLFEQGLGTA